MQPQFHNQYVPPRPVQNSQQDSVVKFLLKLRNNNLNNLKNALRKVGERTHGKKDELLLRLANKLATPEGKDLVKANFKPEIYKDLYEVEIMGDSAANVANPIYQHYRGMIPAGFQPPQANAPHMPYPAPSYNPPKPQFPTPPLPQQNLIKQPVVPQPVVAPKPVAKPVAEPKKNTGGSVIELLDSDDDKPIDAPSKAPTPQIQNLPVPIKTQPTDCVQLQPNTLSLAQILTANLVFDAPRTHAINCFCANPNSQFLPNTNQQTQHQLLSCQTCQNQVHLFCQEANKQMKKSNIDQVTKFVCHICQFRKMDPLCQPIATILAPRILPKLTSQEVKARARQAAQVQEFTIKEQFYTELNKAGNFGNNKYLKVQVRCIRLDGIGFEHMWPKFGQLRLNNGQATEWKMPPPPNDQKKRHDETQDITTGIRRGKNTVDAYQEQKDHAGFHNHPGHIMAVYLVKQITPEELLQHTRHFHVEDIKVSIQRAKEFFSNKKTVDNELSYVEKDADMHQIDQVLLNSNCPITMCPIGEAVRGEHCTHLQCFDLGSFVSINAKHKRWQCPICNKRTLVFNRDLFFTDLLRGFLRLQEADPQVEDKFYLEYNLDIKTLRERGKYHDKYRMIMDQDTIKEFQLVEKNCNQKLNDKASPMSTATTDNYPSEDHVGGKRLATPAEEEPASKRQKTNNQHAPVEID